MRRKLAVCVLALFYVGALALTHGPSAQTIDPLENCRVAGLDVVVVSGKGVCTHGGDLLLNVDTLLDDIEPSRAPCVGDGVSGKRVVMIYGWPGDRANKYTATRAKLREMAAQVDFLLDESNTAADQHVRWLCNAKNKVVVRNVKLKAVGTDASFTFNDMYSSLVNQGFTATDRIYVTYVDQITEVYEFGGQGTVDNDDSSASSNANNTGPAYSLVAYLSPSTFLHELGHNLGAVQHSAPHSTGRWHCWDDQDVMCYNDGGNYVQTDPLAALEMCPNGPETQFDCNHNDYYNPVGSVTKRSGGAIWNTSNSGFLSGVSRCTLPSTC